MANEHVNLIGEFFSPDAKTRDDAVSTITDIAGSITSADAAFCCRALLAVACTDSESHVVESALNSLIYLLEQHSLELDLSRLLTVLPHFDRQSKAHAIYLLGVWGNATHDDLWKSFLTHRDPLLQEAAQEAIRAKPDT